MVVQGKVAFVGPPSFLFPIRGLIFRSSESDGMSSDESRRMPFTYIIGASIFDGFKFS